MSITVGIDFAIQTPIDKEEVKFIKSNLTDVDFSEESSSRLLVLCNVACYLSNDQLEQLLKNATRAGTNLLIIDPIPGLFWDATFDRVKLYYRTPYRMTTLLQKYGYEQIQLSKDYLLKTGKLYWIPLSYASIYSYTEKGEIKMKP